MTDDDCCCGNPDCTDFKDRMLAQGIPLEDITEVVFEVKLEERTDGMTDRR